MIARAHPETPAAQAFRRQLRSSTLLGAYLVARTPLAAFAGLKVRALDGSMCEVEVPYGWRTRNPFGSIYFAAQSMAAEMSCAALALMAARASGLPMSVLPIEVSATFEKKAGSRTTFRCLDGAVLFEAANRALESGQGETVRTHSVGRLEDGGVVSRFEVLWSFKAKSSSPR